MKVGTARKFTSPFKGPFRVVSQQSPVNYVIETTRGRYKKEVCHVARMKKFFDRQEMDNSDVEALAGSDSEDSYSRGDSDFEVPGRVSPRQIRDSCDVRHAESLGLSYEGKNIGALPTETRASETADKSCAKRRVVASSRSIVSQNINSDRFPAVSPHVRPERPALVESSVDARSHTVVERPQSQIVNRVPTRASLNASMLQEQGSVIKLVTPTETQKSESLSETGTSLSTMKIRTRTPSFGSKTSAAQSPHNSPVILYCTQQKLQFRPLLLV